jgi:hypothetical protein
MDEGDDFGARRTRRKCARHDSWRKVLIIGVKKNSGIRTKFGEKLEEMPRALLRDRGLTNDQIRACDLGVYIRS